MEDIQSSLAIASHQFDKGQIKDAYSIFLATAQSALQPLFDTKFVRSSVVSKPQDSTALISALHLCLDHIEKILEYHSVSAKVPPPPIPPKPTLVGKPALPPKPSTVAAPVPIPSRVTVKRSLSDHEIIVTQQREQQRTYTRSNLCSMDEAVPDGEVDPNHLVPAQTNSNDSLPNATAAKIDHVPNIPVPPLLTSHRMLQSKLDELESSLKEFRLQKTQLGIQDTQKIYELDAAIAKYTPYVAEAKHTLNRVRTLYMSAATIPSILHFQPALVAYQLTRIESAIFMAIPPHALLTHSPKSPHSRIVASSDFFNYITRWIEHSILLPQEASIRSQHINHWIKIAWKCQELNNYQTLKAIVSALGTPPVQRLKRTWAYIPKKSLARLDTMNELMSETNNYGRYREHMGIVSTAVLNGKSVDSIQSEHLKKPTVPFLGTFIHDMTYLLAAVNQEQKEKDPRILKLLEILGKFQSTPTYHRKPSSNVLKKSQSQVRPSLSQAIHRSKSSFGRLGGAIGFGGSHTDNSSTGDASNANFSDTADDFNAEEQQSLVTQYILMRPWVNQTMVDELSLLREPPTNTKCTGRANSISNSVMSTTSSLMLLGNQNYTTSSAPIINSSRPTSLDDPTSRSYIYGRGSAQSSIPLTSSSTFEDEDEDEEVLSSPASTSYPVILSPKSDSQHFWSDPVINMYNKEAAPMVPPRPSPSYRSNPSFRP
ncbi:Ras-specific guanine nucleotide-releasing factor RalGPS1 [Choanephora cucurbitarum]|uniref:Ras-specific guanine nucleotide-releasing factor RalGPS1 n=1 Tax=Choanephora cucurbitarum TaxID=101091 RepID=A0A1C7N8T6_9FUNG|nr:Ras-specific guanine nucleotide-releasing factor RalGPS1 [Choanephora cucurbitarum]